MNGGGGKKNCGLLRQNLERMEDSNFLQLQFTSPPSLTQLQPRGFPSRQRHCKEGAVNKENLFVPLKEASISNDEQ